MRKRLLCVLLVLVAMVTPAAAQIPDPVEIALLAEIYRALVEVYRILDQINGFVQDFRDLQQTMFPREALDELKMLFRSVNSVTEEIEKMSCAWRFSPRVDGLRLGLLRKGPLCRSEYQRLVGRLVPGIDSDLAEMRQWNAVRRLNTVASTFEASRDWTAAANRYGAITRAGGTSPGRAIRYLGALAALELQQEVRANTQEAELLSAAQEELDAEMREDLRRQNHADQLTRWVIASEDVLRRQSLARDLLAGSGR